jgi:gephyrin
MDGPLKAAILIVSTTAAKDPSADASADVLRSIFQDQGAGKWEVTQTEIVSDDVLAIQRLVVALADGPDAVNLIVTTGGTGFAVADGTPEVREAAS